MIKPFIFLISVLLILGCISSAMSQDTDDSKKSISDQRFNEFAKILLKENMLRIKQNSAPDQKLTAADIFLPYCTDAFILSHMLSELDNGQMEKINYLCMILMDSCLNSMKRCYLLLTPETASDDKALSHGIQKKSWDAFNFVKNNDKIFSKYRRFSEILNCLYLTLPPDQQKELVSYVNHNYPALSEKVTTLSDIDNIYEKNDYDNKSLQYFYFNANYNLSNIQFTQEIITLANQNDLDLLRNLIVSQINYKKQMIDVLVTADPSLKSDQTYQQMIKDDKRQ